MMVDDLSNGKRLMDKTVDVSDYKVSGTDGQTDGILDKWSLGRAQES